MIAALLAAATTTMPAACAQPADRIIARQCEAAAAVGAADWGKAAEAFELAAREAQVVRDARAAELYVQAGNAALAGGKPAQAMPLLTAAIASGTLTGEALGEAHLDRGRAQAALGRLPEARADLDQALKLLPADPLGWLLSATLARRAGDLTRATEDIQQAATRAPDDSSVAFEAGNIAVLSGRDAAARTAWEAATRLQPDSPAARAAAESLARLGR